MVIEVSKRNYNRYAHGTHSLKRVLELEGFEVGEEQGVAYMVEGEAKCSLTNVSLRRRAKIVDIPPAKKDPEPVPEAVPETQIATA